ncbi:MAG: helix-turn-helix transcriptional regulator [Gammaproteobacteria bacterium]|nr:helix-turn-helix transcriptional regulator [Gammaproteobacteria bacterium]
MQLQDNHFFYTASPLVREICAPLAKLNINHFSFTKSYTSGKRIYLTTHVSLLHHYFLDELYLIGNCENNPSGYQEQTLLWSTLPKQQLFQHERNLGLMDGIFVIRPAENFTEFFNFSTTLKNCHVINIFMTHYDVFKNFIPYFKEKAASIIREAERHHLILPFHSNSLNQKNAIVLPEPELNGLFIKNKIRLSRQQSQCAFHLLKGKSTKSIAKALNLSPRTIETYINNMKIKLAVNNKTELLIELAGGTKFGN